jgi:hypothetical protein
LVYHLVGPLLCYLVCYLLMSWIKVRNLVCGLLNECIVVRVALLAREMWPLEPISNGMLLQK